MTELSPQEQAFQQYMKETRKAAADKARNIWDNLDSYEEKDIDPFTKAVTPWVYAGQSRAISGTSAFLTNTIGLPDLTHLNPDDIIPNIRGGIDPRKVYARSFQTVWDNLENDIPHDEAVRRGGNRIWAAAGMSVLLAFTAGAVKYAEQNNAMLAKAGAERVIIGYKRTADPACCSFCTLVDGAFVFSADSMPLHNNCTCTLTPVMGKQRTLDEMTAARDARNDENRYGWHTEDASPETKALMEDMLKYNSTDVSVIDRGELGPYLGPPQS